MAGETTDQALITSALGGNHTDLRELVGRLTPVIQAAVARTLTSGARASGLWNLRAEVADQTQEIFALLFEDRGAILQAWDPTAGASLRTFIALVARRRTVSMLRSARRNPWTDQPVDDEALTRFASRVSTLEQRLIATDLVQRAFADVSAGLTEQGREFLQRLVMEDWTTDQMRETYDLSTSAVHQWRSRLLRKLRARLHDLLSEQP